MVIVFIGPLYTASHNSLQFTVTHKHKLVAILSSSLSLLVSDFQQRTFRIFWILGHCYQLLTATVHRVWTAEVLRLTR
jgi:hypothetical protein